MPAIVAGKSMEFTMYIVEQQIGAVVVAKLAGRLDAATAPSASNHLRRLISANVPRLILDLSELSYISSAGIRVLQSVLRDVRSQSGTVRLSGLQPPIQQTLELVGLMPALDVYDDVAAAIHCFL